MDIVYEAERRGRGTARGKEYMAGTASAKGILAQKAASGEPLKEDDGRHCPHCGRYVGPVETCPYCWKKIRRRREILYMKYGSLAFALLGTFLLLNYAVYFVDNPRMDVADLDRQHNYGKIMIVGEVTDTPRYYPLDYSDSGTLYFNVDDGTGIITVKAYADATETMMEEGKVPAFGDKVRVKGTFQYRGDDKSLILDSERNLEILRPAARQTDISELDGARPDAWDDGARVLVRGHVSGAPSDLGFAVSLYLTDGAGNEVNVFIPQTLMEIYGDGYVRELWTGDEVEVEGALKYYSAGTYSRWEVIPADVDDVRVLDWNASEPPEGWVPPAGETGGGEAP